MLSPVPSPTLNMTAMDFPSAGNPGKAVRAITVNRSRVAGKFSFTLTPRRLGFASVFKEAADVNHSGFWSQSNHWSGTPFFRW